MVYGLWFVVSWKNKLFPEGVRFKLYRYNNIKVPGDGRRLIYTLNKFLRCLILNRIYDELYDELT